jgi:glutathione S-transferase
MREGGHKRPDYMAKQRYGQVPLLVDTRNGRQLCQSAAILEYFADTLGRFGGATLDERLQVREWLYWEFDRLAAMYRARVIKLGIRPAGPEVYETHVNQATDALKVLDQHLAGRAWLVGEGATIADIDIYGVVAFAGQAGIDLAPFEHVRAWIGRFEAQPGFGRPQDLLPQDSRAAA